ncbi:preprotein translocase subunit SecE [uncultured Allofournierella sp.]|uniref:preprotein translocase subunit SecE n=1 Tax=uncultured Allofournierella sp. TaxID=1940258 RepID=UPI003751F6CE
MADNNAKKPGFFAKVKNSLKGIGKFFRETKGEMKKVVWPTKSQIINNTIVVLVVVIAASLFILLLDMLFGGILRLVLDAAAGL